jgi:hypothetical protein
VNAVMNLTFPLNVGNSLTARGRVSIRNDAEFNFISIKFASLI